MAKSMLRLGRLGFHVLPTLFMLLNSLRKHVERVLNEEEDADADYPFPVVVADLYSDDPWHVLNDDDQWVVHNCNDPRLNSARRSIYVFTELTPLGRKRFVRSAGSGTWDGATGCSKIPRGNHDECIGTKKYFDFKSTESPREGRKGHWRMNEYRLAGKMLKGLENFSLATRIVLCEITQEVDKTFGMHLGWTKTALDEVYSAFVQRGYFRRPDEGERKQLPDQEVEENLSMYNDGDGYSNKGTRFYEREIENLMKKRIENRKELTEDLSTINSDKWRTVSTMPNTVDKKVDPEYQEKGKWTMHDQEKGKWTMHDQEKGKWTMHEYLLKPIEKAVALCQITHEVTKDLALRKNHKENQSIVGVNLELALGKNHKENQLMTIEETDESTGDEMHTSYPSVGDQYQIADEPEAGLHGFQTAEDDGHVTIPKTFDFFNKELQFPQELSLPVPAYQPSEFIEFF